MILFRRMVRIALTFAVAAGLMPVAAPLGAQTPRPLEIDDLFRIHQVGDPRLSPDGGWIAYAVSTTSLEENKSETRIWMVPAAGGDAIPMTAEGSSASSPRWSPDGKYLSFLAARNGKKTQVWVLDRRGGEARALTDIEEGVGGYDWSPDGTRLVLAIRDPEEKDEEKEKEKKDAPKDPWVVDRLQFKRDGTGYLTGDRRTHLYVFDVATRTLTQITSGRYDEGQAAWSPDGTRIAFVSNRTDEPDANDNSDIWVVPADNTDRGATLVRVTTNSGSDAQPAWSPDGKWIAHVTATEPDLIWYATSHLAVAAADDSGDVRIMTRALDRNVSTPRFSADGRRIYFRLEDSAEDHLARIDIGGGAITRPIAGHLSVGGYDLGRDGAVVAVVSRPDLPGEVFALDRGGLRKITAANDSLLAAVRLAEVRNIHFRSRDGTEIEGFLHLPVGYREGIRYPTLLRIHGGPVSQFSAEFNFEAQLFAAHGYAVVTTNPRGSSGYGQEFSRAIWADWGNRDFEDVMAGIDFAIAEGVADSTRLGVGGWSYGGILTNYVITKSGRFRAAITGASEVFYPANYGHDHYQLQWEKELGLPWETMETWLRLSPFTKVADITTPTLVMGGEDDWNVPIQNSEQLYQALRRRGVPTQLVVYPGQGHGLRVPAYQKDRLERYLRWYERWLKNRGATTE